MSILASRLALALVLAALALGGRNAHAQAGPVSYWIPGWPLGFGGNMADGQGANRYGNFPSFDSGDARGGGFSVSRYNFPNGWFVGSQSGSIGLNGIGSSFSGLPSMSSDGVQFGYDFKARGGLPVTLTAGFNSLKYNNMSLVGSPFDASSSTASGFSAHAGVEYKPTSNVSLSLGFGYTQQPDVNSMSLPGASTLSVSGRR